MEPSITTTSWSRRYASCRRATASKSSRVIVLPEERSATTCVLSAEREVTWVCTLTLSYSVTRHRGIASVNRRRSSGEGLSCTAFASTVIPRLLVGSLNRSGSLVAA
jgi:hypothetical protein